MRHYDRAGYRHLDDGERYRDHEYLADDGWVGPNEHGNWGTSAPRAQDLSSRGAAQAEGARVDRAPVSFRPFPDYAQSPPPPSYEGRGPRREPPPERPAARPARPAPARTGGLVGALLHPRQAMQRAVRGLFSGRGPKNWTRSDQRIHDDVCERLAHHHDVDASDVEVIVKEGEVTLSGVIESRAMKYLAEDAVAEVLGVKDVHNRLRLASRAR